MGKRNFITCGRAARMAGIHPNTLRWYESAGYLPPLPRTPGGYRMYSPGTVQLARIVKMSQPLLRFFGPIRRTAGEILASCRDGKEEEALRKARALAEMLRREQALAVRALSILEEWRNGRTTAAPGRMLFIGEAAKLTGLTRDRIINWERNGLCAFPRSPGASYRLFGGEELDRLLVIRYCRTAGYSITAIRRVLRAVDEGLESGREIVEAIADTPHPDELKLFPAFPTDTLLSSLKELEQLVQRLIPEILDLKPKNSNPPI